MIQHIDMFQGENRTVTLTAKDSNNIVFNLTGMTIAFNVGRPPNDPDNTFSNPQYTGTVVSAPAGTYTVAILPADTGNLAPGNYLHQTYTTDSSGNITVVNQGKLRLRPLVSQFGYTNNA